MIYLDNAATTLRKPPQVARAMVRALYRCANPGRGGHPPAARAEEAVYRVRSLAGRYFRWDPERICFTANATEGLNVALNTLVSPGDRVVISGLEHNAVTRTLEALGAEAVAVAAPLFDGAAWLEAFDRALTPGTAAAVCLQVSNVYGCQLPVEEIGAICRRREIPFVVDASQGAGLLPVRPGKWGAAFVAMPGHKGLLGPQGTGLLLCGDLLPEPLRRGGTGTASARQTMPEELPERLEAGTLNVPGICGLGAGLQWLLSRDPEALLGQERRLLARAARGLEALGAKVWTGPNQTGVLSFTMPGRDCEDLARDFGRRGICLRAGLHCAPLAHRTGGSFPEGTVRLSLSPLTRGEEVEGFLRAAGQILGSR